jgi:dihydroorotate dehydrogenase
LGGSGYADPVPDWFYRTLARPLLFRMPVERAQSLACGLLGRVGRLPLGAGGAVIDFLGHMRPDPRLAVSAMGREWIGSVGLGLKLDGGGLAARAWPRFGVSFVEYGPVEACAAPASELGLEIGEEALRYRSLATFDAETISERLRSIPAGPVHRILRIRAGVAGDVRECAESVAAAARRLLPCAEMFAVEFGGRSCLPDWPEDSWSKFWDRVRSAAPDLPWLLAVAAGCERGRLLPALREADGLVLEASEEEGAFCRAGPSSKPLLLKSLASLRQDLGGAFPIIASGGIHQPIDAKEALDAGATLVQLDTGLVFAGPGLPKRTNEAILSMRASPEQAVRERPALQSWFWTGAMGLGMLIGSIMALCIALTQVVLPYDEAFCGITRDQIAGINERLLPFMSHDRVALAGTMIAIGLLYLNFSWFGIRLGEHWAKTAVLASAAAGFFSFFLFLGFGYFDPFHGFVTAVLFQLFVQGIVGGMPPRPPTNLPDWTESREWRLGQWGQLLLVLHGLGLLGAGLVICAVGIGDVLVATDLDYLRTDLAELRSANPRLIPLVAHDRATLGGMLLASGIVYLLGSLWGMRRGNAWLWHAFLWSALAAYACAIGIHYWIGYENGVHLFPAYAGLALLLGGLALCRPWMLGRRTGTDPAP